MFSRAHVVDRILGDELSVKQEVKDVFGKARFELFCIDRRKLMECTGRVDNAVKV